MRDITAMEGTFVCENCEKEFSNSLPTKCTVATIAIMPGARPTERVFHSRECADESMKRGGTPRRTGWLRWLWRD